MQDDSTTDDTATSDTGLSCFSHVAEVLKRGGVIAYPTESCFGLGCDPHNHAAVRRLLKIKRRCKSKGLILVSDSFSRFKPFVCGVPEANRDLVFASWPGPNTWLLPARSEVSSWLTGKFKSIAVRVSKDKTVRGICSKAEMAIVSTSANRAGRPALRAYEHVVLTLGKDVDYVVPGRIGTQKSPSTIRDGLTGEVIRGEAVP